MSVIYILLPVACLLAAGGWPRSSGPSAAGSSTTWTRRRFGCCTMTRTKRTRRGESRKQGRPRK